MWGTRGEESISAYSLGRELSFTSKSMMITWVVFDCLECGCRVIWDVDVIVLLSCLFVCLFVE